MGLIKCKECSKKISKKAKQCPDCGAPLKKKTSIVTWLVAILAVPFLYMILNADRTPTAKQDRLVTEITAKEARAKEIRQGFSSWNGSHKELEYWVKSKLKDPDSYEHIETRYSDEGDHLALVMKYRAKNGFGGYTAGSVIATSKISGELIEIISNK